MNYQPNAYVMLLDRGKCQCNEGTAVHTCQCDDGYEGNECECQKSKETCRDPENPDVCYDALV